MEKLEWVVATTNLGKLKEIEVALKKFPIQLFSLNQIGFGEKIIEDKATFQENAILKATLVAQKTGKLTLADDSGLIVDALGGAPGVYSARFAGEKASDRENNRKLLQLLKDISSERRRAHFHCAMALASPEKLIHTVEGICFGSIGFEEKGGGGFGYDPLFIPENYDKTFAELGDVVKNKISHRAKALQQLSSLLKDFIG